MRLKIEGTARTAVDTTAPTLDSATVDGTSLVLTYNEALDTSSEPATSAYSVSVAGGAGAAPSSVNVSGMTVTLTLGTAVTAGQTVTVTYTMPTSNPVQDTADNDTLTYTLEGTNAGKFSIVSGASGGQITTKVGQSDDYETRTGYTVTVKVSDGNGGADTIVVTLTVTNETETPLAPTVTAAAGVTMTLDVTWTAPNNTGRPTITGSDLQSRKGTTGPWTDGPQDETGTSASITKLDGNATYQVQVRASNADGDGAWSSPGSGETVNTPPVFANDSTVRFFAETVGEATVQTAADIDTPVTATDADDDMLAYSLEGTDADQFTIVPETGQLRTKVGEAYDREAKAS